jgi:hypothetical protein
MARPESNQKGVEQMLDRNRHRLTYANVMATIAVFGVLAGGGAYAASKIGPSDIARNAVRSKHIKDSQVKRRDIAAKLIEGLVSGPGSVLAGSATLIAGGGGNQPVLDVPGLGAIQGGCGSGGGEDGAGLRLLNQSGIELRVFGFSNGDDSFAETVADGASSSLSAGGTGTQGFHLLQASGGGGADLRSLTAIATSTASDPSCEVHVQVFTNVP